MVEYRQLSDEEKRICLNSLNKLNQEKAWLELDIQILQLKLSKWEVTKSKMQLNAKKTIASLETQLENFKKMQDNDFSEQLQDIHDQINELQRVIESDLNFRINTVQEQLTKGVLKKSVF